LRSRRDQRPLQRLLPALKESLALLLHQLGHQGFGPIGQLAQLLHAVAQHGRQISTLPLARGRQIGVRLAG